MINPSTMRSLFTFAVALTLIAPARPAEEPTNIDMLSHEIADRRGRIWSMQGSYTATVLPDSLAESANKMIGVAREAEATFAWSGQKRLLAETYEAVRPDMSTARTSAANVYDGSEFRRRERKSFLIQAAKSSAADGNQFLNALFWPMSESELAQCRERPSETTFLPYCFSGAGWTVTPERVVVNGTECLLAKKVAVGRRYWLAPSLGYCLIRAELERPRTGVRRVRFDYNDVREVAKDVFLPREIVIEKETEDKQGISTGTLTTRIVANGLTVNNVPDSVFVLEPKDGD